MSHPSHTTASGVTPAWAQVPDTPRMGRYLLGPELGRGGMGRVHEAWDLVLGRSVAVKVLHGSDPIHLVRLLREAQAQARLQHPGICRILDAETDAEAGLSFIAMERIHGPTLAELRTQLDAHALAAILADVASAVHAAHQAGLVHRDLKPANILVEPTSGNGWRPVVVDFGLARDLAWADQTLSWSPVGTPAYMSPQQARGETPSPSDDLYALGATLHSMLTGAPPFEATTLVGYLTEQAGRDPGPLRPRHPGVPRDLETITLACLASDPHRRYPSAQALEADLRRFLAGEPLEARPTGWLERTWRQARRQKPLLATAAVALLTVGGLTTFHVIERAVSRRQVELAQRFGLEARDIENRLRMERMLPAHDLSPAEAEAWHRLGELTRLIRSLGRVAEGPGYLAVGRVQFALRDYSAAQASLERSWAVGYRSPELSEALGLVHAERYQREALRAQAEMDDGLEARLADLRKRHGEPSRTFLRSAAGAQLAPIHLALLEDRWDDAIQAAQVAVKRHPWQYEALLLEARARLTAGRRKAYHEGWEAERLRPVFAEVEAVLERAEALGPSDVAIAKEHLELMLLQGIQQSESGRPSLDGYERAFRIVDSAQKVAPRDAELWAFRSYVLEREAFIRLAAGEDVRARLAAHVAQLEQAARHLDASVGLKGPREIALWLQGEAQWRRGEDPRKALEAALTLHPRPTLNQVEILNVLARHAAQHGLDVDGLTRRAEGLMREHFLGPQSDFYAYTLLGETLTVRAQWEAFTGRDTAATLRRGIEALEHAIRLKPGCVYAWFHLPLLRSLEAERRMARGEDPREALAAALEAGRRAVAIRPDHYRSQLGLGEAHLANAIWQLKQGRDASPALAGARAALAQAQAHNATDWRIAWSQARLALLQAHSGPSPKAALEAARAARRGLQVKEDAPELHWALAEASRLAGDTTDAEVHAKRMLALCPEFRVTRDPVVARLSF